MYNYSTYRKHEVLGVQIPLRSIPFLLLGKKKKGVSPI